MAEPVRWGIMGMAQIARDEMGPAIHMARGAQLAAVATSSPPAKCDPLVRLVPGIRVLQGYEALLADPGIEAVYIPLPNHLHGGGVRFAAQHDAP